MVGQYSIPNDRFVLNVHLQMWEMGAYKTIGDGHTPIIDVTI